ncbi:TIGR04197 family type VII secretion effector [Streptococcus sanguinis]|jgi:hypothetical protein|uniref:TIGR04197 family type VII secretion effector n=2 Tax=Streptococcus sanguinis TaxID=1305 RepID=F0IUR4_STRSA|nr:TIGR04197 family type VII secretion effector [Streptococcus sanguinis]EGD31775.1 hypothetical protein HMPREF9382_0729 [Streptococcus sanguinis SK115]EGD38319.1 hypothetical protein HMPREF9384_1576 [Streptococcus sanguinis SK160]MBZ2026571.1 TIGR04197 family type VII secretion effector [Streptococcus sanguinis]MBZ2052255.1 TIGR04197 family type VII secretion effector [Streptococcus sanguinis]MCY7012646.1 TIGR04197 family type VII secretion effector [Streptococcus sanguinis]
MSGTLLSNSEISATHSREIKVVAAKKEIKTNKDTVSRYSGNSLAHNHLDKEKQMVSQMLESVSQFADCIQEIGINFDLMDSDIASKIG